MQAVRKIIQKIIGKFQMPNSTKVTEAAEPTELTEQRPKASSAKLTAQEAMVAIYIDYEGNMKMPPTLLGWYVDGEYICLLYTSPSPRDGLLSRMPSSA